MSKEKTILKIEWVLIALAIFVYAASEIGNRYLRLEHEASEGAKNRAVQNRATEALLQTTHENNQTKIYLECRKAGRKDCKNPYEQEQ